MYDKILILKFENAGIFKKNFKKNTDESFNKEDRILEGTSRELRTKDQWIEPNLNTLAINFIENVLLVLSGKRPVPRFRHTEFTSDMNEIAKRCGVKFTSLTSKTKDGTDIFITEKMTTRKCLHNSWGQCYPSWERIKYLISDSLFNELIKISKEICNIEDPTTLLFSDVATILVNSKDSRVTDIVEKARDEEVEPLAKLLVGGKQHELYRSTYKGLGPYLKTLVVKGVSDIVRLDGELCIPLYENEVKSFRNGPGFATILEGGLVLIDKIIDLEYTNEELITCNYKDVY